MFSIRRMRPDDKPALLEIASRIWEGSDYIPGVFDEWVTDARGEFAAVLLKGRLVGCGKLTFLTDTDAWLEGLRKDPRVPQTGLGRVVAEHFLSLLAARKDLSSVRFSTYVKNHASIVTNERLGFRARTVLSVKAWQGSRIDLAGAATRERAARSSSRMEVSTIRDERVIREFLQRSDYFQKTQGLIAEGWRVFPYSASRFVERYAPVGACRGVLREGSLAGLAAWTLGSRPGRTGVKLVFLDAADDVIAGALLDEVFRSLTEVPARAVGAGESCEIEWMVPPGERFRRWCSGRSLASWEREDDFLVCELPLEELRRHAADGKRSKQ
jgi:hypothetical protein